MENSMEILLIFYGHSMEISRIFHGSLMEILWNVLEFAMDVM